VIGSSVRPPASFIQSNPESSWLRISTFLWLRILISSCNAPASQRTSGANRCISEGLRRSPHFSERLTP
jgi:hypothetical protein